MIGIPAEVITQIFVKPLSGSGALGIYTDNIKTCFIYFLCLIKKYYFSNIYRNNNTYYLGKYSRP